MMHRYLTKSRFKLALECPTKLFYTRKKEYPDSMSKDPFMEALAEGGFQVGELAKCYYPRGHDITTLDYEEAIEQTDFLLQQEDVVIFEAAFRYENLFIRADIVEKTGNRIKLIEVKSKSFDGDDQDFIGKRSGSIKPAWQPYLFDVAFQKYVINKAKPNYQVKAYLMMADKTKLATVNGLNQKFQLFKNEDDRAYCKVVGDVLLTSLGEEILVKQNVDSLVEMIHGGEQKSNFQHGYDFEDWIMYLSDQYAKDIKINIPIHKGCGSCQFICTPEDEKRGMKSGFKECWREKASFADSDFERPLIFELWKGGMGSKDIITSLIEKKSYFLNEIEESDYASKSKAVYSALSPTERRTVQIDKCRDGDMQPYVDIEGLRSEMAKWEFPLHFIDFETSSVAIPFNAGRRPYEGIAFQFSHHQVEEDGKITHKGQYLNTAQGQFPNFDFVRALKNELDQDEGTIFRYAAHENTFLNMIYRQLKDSSEEDKHTLMEFIQTITKSGNDSTEKWQGARNMVDLLEMVKNYYYHPIMKGSNSIKVVLPAVLNASSLLQDKYSKPIYGIGKEISSLNFDEIVWLSKDEDGEIINPYKLLPDIFDGVSEEEMDKYVTNSKLADGGAAMTAYAKMQFTQMTGTERQKIADGLLRYCELDTLAMVFIWEHWSELIKATNPI